MVCTARVVIVFEFKFLHARFERASLESALRETLLCIGMFRCHFRTYPHTPNSLTHGTVSA
jgi:hypothetical protein